jgi:hypothetical protein
MKSDIADKLYQNNEPILINPRMAPANVKRITAKMPIQDMIPQKSKPEPEEIKLVANNKPSVGNEVFIKWNDGTWYDGKISKILKGGLVTVEYDDRDVQNHRLLEKSKNISWRFKKDIQK